MTVTTTTKIIMTTMIMKITTMIIIMTTMTIITTTLLSRPVPPNLVYCGMMQCRPGKELPADLQQVPF